jgi:hypothetical protein
MHSTRHLPPLHREHQPPRRCEDCGAWLTSFNDSDTCWSHDSSWTVQLDEDTLSNAIREEIGDAIDRILTPEAILA